MHKQETRCGGKRKPNGGTKDKTKQKTRSDRGMKENNRGGNLASLLIKGGKAGDMFESQLPPLCVPDCGTH